MAPTPSWPTLRNGLAGKNVQALQALLIYHKYPVTLNGRFDGTTEEAVRSFQKKHSLTPDTSYGIVGENTLSALIVTLPNTTSDYAVRAAQYLLSKFETVTVNGDFNSSSNVIISFHEKMGMTPNITVDYLTWRYLFGYSSYPPNASVGTSSTLNEAQMYVNAKYILRYLTNQGFTKNAACGILGNFLAESRIDPGVWESGYFDVIRGGYGLAQWTTYKYAENKNPNPFMIHAADIGLISDSKACSELDSLALSNPKKLMDAELAWLVESMGSTEYFFYNADMNHTGRPKMTFKQFKASTLDASELAVIFHDYYERSNDSYDAITKNRATPAQNYFDTGSFV